MIDGITVDRMRRLVTLGGLSVRLTLQQFIVFELLLAAKGELVPLLDIYRALYGKQACKPKVVQVAICIIRSKIAALDLTIHSVRAHGYFLSESPRQAANPATAQAAAPSPAVAGANSKVAA